MDKPESPQPSSPREQSNQPSPPSSDKKFLVELTVSQANLIARNLPRRYSILVQRQNKPKRASKKKNTESRKQITSNLYEFQEPSERTKKIPNRYSQEFVEINNYSRASSQGLEDVEDPMKPCLRILNLLKGHRCSWPFKTPVDPVALNIPNYFQIIKQPMDLQTIEQNLRSKAYITPTQFHVDVKKIIRNSFDFNKDNQDFTKLTSQFQKFYMKISNDTNRGGISKRFSDSIKKSKQSSRGGQFGKEPNQFNPVTLQEKKELAVEIKKLPKQYLFEVAQLVYKDKIPTSQQLNLQTLPSQKIRELQKLVREKLSFIRIHGENPRQQQRANNQIRSEESSFESDSDS